MLQPRILIADDEPMHLESMSELLSSEGYAVIACNNGLSAFEALKKDKEISVIVLDRTMPILDGIEVVQKLKGIPELKHTPIIMQTAAQSSVEIREGLALGIYHYLVKPVTTDILLTSIRAAELSYNQHKLSLENFREAVGSSKVLESATYTFRTLGEARHIAGYIAYALPSPEDAYMCLTELMNNSIEHGNLEIDSKTKQLLLKKATLLDEIEARLNQQPYANKYATLSFKKTAKEIVISIKDQGKGFNAEPYKTFQPHNNATLTGRGIHLAITLGGFSEINYLGNGNEVECIYRFPDSKAC